MHIKTCKRNDYLAELRPRERLSDGELLAILLSTGSKETNVLDLTSNLLQMHKGIAGLRDLSLEELTRQKGLAKPKRLPC